MKRRSRSISKNKERSIATQFTVFRVVHTRDHVRSPYSPVHIPRLLSSILIPISRTALCTPKRYPYSYADDSYILTNDGNYAEMCTTRARHASCFRGSFRANPTVGPHCYFPLSLIRNCSGLSKSARETREEEQSALSPGGGEGGGRRSGWRTGRNEMTNVDGMRIHLRPCVPCHLSPLASGSLNFTSRYTSLTRTVYCSFSDNAVLLSAVPFIIIFFFFSSDNEHDASQLAHCSPRLRTKLLLGDMQDTWREVYGVLLLTLLAKKYC